MISMLLLQTSTPDIPAILVLCGAVSAALLAYIFYLPFSVSSAPEKTRLAFLRERKDVVYENLRDLNFEYKAGKYSEADYQEMHAALEQEAAAILAETEKLERDAARPRFQSLLRGKAEQKTKGARL